MTEPDNTDSLGFLAFAKRVSKLEGDLIDTQGRLRELERRLEDFTSPPIPATIIPLGTGGATGAWQK